MIPLVVRSHYSLMRGTEPVERLVKRARRLGYRKLALTDTDNLYGLWPFLAACRREGVTPIVGAELTDPGTAGRRAVCLAETAEGYANLCRLITRRHMDEKRFSLAAISAEEASGLIALTPDAELLTAWHAAGLRTAAVMGRKPVPAAHRNLFRTAGRLDVPVVAAPDSYFGTPADIGVHRMLRAVDGNTTVSRLSPADVAPADAWLAGPEEYERRFAACPETIRATESLAERLAFTGPSFGIVLPPWKDANGRNAADCLREAAYAGAKNRYGAELSEPVVDRLEHELSIIRRMGFPAYFLIVRDIVTQSPRICGRGSGAASLVAYCLGITNVCPVKHNLYFGRFLNPGRKDPPDIDIDFAWDERDDVLSAVLEKHRGHAAMVANHVCIQPRMAIREVAKVFGLTDGEIGAVSRRLPGYWRSDGIEEGLLARLRQRPETGRMGFPPPWPEILELAGRIVGAPRYLSVHPGGVVITPGPIDTYVPLQRAPKGVPILQWEKEGIEDAGLVKIDLLGNRSLGVIRDAVENLRTNGGGLDETRWEPEDDPETQEALAQGQTMGCFYIESPAMRLLQKKARVGDFEHLVIHSSIIRPAANEFIQEYIRRLHGGAWDPIHPLLSDVLSETFGIMVYQEDVSRTAVALAGFSDADADGMRKILSKKDRARHLEDFRDRFFAGARTRGVAEEKIAAVWSMMMSFSGYSFCKPHSASYARVSFQAAYLKVHHPAEFMAAVISNQGGFYSTFAYVSEARRMGLSVLPPDVNESRDRWTGNGNSGCLRVGLLSVKGLSADLRARIVEQRGHAGPFRSMKDFLQRTRPDEPDVRALIDAGALDELAPDGRRTALLWQLARFRESVRKRRAARSLFDLPATDTPPPFPRKSVMDRLRREFAVLGFLCDRHPMVLYENALKSSGRIPAANLARAVGRRVRMAGWLITGKKVQTKHGDTMEFLTFEDETGIAETVFFPDAYRRYCHLLDWGRPYLLTGTVEQDWGAVTLTVDRLAPIARPDDRSREEAVPANPAAEIGPNAAY